MVEDVLENLNEEQIEAVTSTEGYIRVVAGAGSGKTKTLTSRYLYLVDQLGISTANILCVTFTNKAAAEMKKRIRQSLPDQLILPPVPPVKGVVFTDNADNGSFHGCARKNHAVFWASPFHYSVKSCILTGGMYLQFIL
jgi:superfamily I DNA/RNA helicase